MIPLSSQSDSIFFPLDRQIKIFRDRFIESKDQKKFLLSGIKQNAIFSKTGCNILSDPVVNFFDKEYVGLSCLLSLLIIVN